jgi:hypothetical protein
MPRLKALMAEREGRTVIYDVSKAIDLGLIAA